MKKIFLSVAACIVLFSSAALAEEASSLSEQTLKFDENKAAIAVQKQPSTDSHNQKAEVKKNWFCIIIQVNGKAPFDKTDNR